MVSSHRQDRRYIYFDTKTRNMFLAASPYFQHRFSSSSQLLAAFPSAIIAIPTATNLVVVAVLAFLQSGANYPNRVILSQVLNAVAFTLLALSTVFFKNVSTPAYFAFVMFIDFMTAMGTGLCQNGAFAYVSGFGVEKYTQGIMTGQAVAGVLPCIVQIISVLSVSPPDTKVVKGSGPVPQESGKSAFAYFLTATAVSVITLVSFLYLLRRHPYSTGNALLAKPSLSSSSSPQIPSTDDEEDSDPVHTRRSVPILTLVSKLRYIAAAVFLTFGVSMAFPVYTQKITSTHPDAIHNRLLETSCFIPIAFLFWNVGDLCGRLLTLLPSFVALVHYPRVILALSIARVIWVPLYHLCNIDGGGAVISSDVFYLIIVQLLFGLTNGYLGSCCMIGASVWVDEDEREAAGGFMGLALSAGLTIGSLATFGIK